MQGYLMLYVGVWEIYYIQKKLLYIEVYFYIWNSSHYSSHHSARLSLLLSLRFPMAAIIAILQQQPQQSHGSNYSSNYSCWNFDAGMRDWHGGWDSQPSLTSHPILYYKQTCYRGAFEKKNHGNYSILHHISIATIIAATIATTIATTIAIP